MSAGQGTKGKCRGMDEVVNDEQKGSEGGIAYKKTILSSAKRSVCQEVVEGEERTINTRMMP